MKKLLSAMLATLALPTMAFAQAAPALPDADPAMWVVKDKDTTIYLFGTFHALDGKTAWFNDEVKTAFDASQEVVLEALMPDDMAALQPLVVKYGVDPAGKTLSSKLSPEVKTKLDKALAGLGVPPQGLAAMEPLEPWMINMTLAALAGAKIGLKPDSGADKQILASAKAAGKKLGELEGAEFQLAMLDKVPEADQIKQLGQTLDQVDEMGPLLTKMQVAWNKGDTEGLTAIMNEGVSEMPDFYKMIFTDRNATWAEWIGKRMEQPGTVFMAVGAGHLAGKDSVQAMLKAKGIDATRVE
jgi:uncharacterized protein YbaP (TraB family)